MKNISDFIDKNTANAEEMMPRFREIFKKEFPDGWINVRKGALSSDTLAISFGLISNRYDQISNIMDNDPAINTFMMWGKGFQTTGKVVLEKSRGSLDTVSTNQYLAMSHRKLPYRKSTNTPDKVLKAFSNYLKKMKIAVKEEYANNNIYSQDSYPKKYFDF